MRRTSWTESNLLELIKNKTHESLHLDFKRCAALVKGDEKRKNELSVMVSSFANSDGGTIIYGIGEEDHVAKFIDGGFELNDISKEWIEEVITSRISYKIPRVVIHPVHLDKSNSGKYAFVIDVEKSEMAPHMASDHVYYKRHNFKSCPMEHYEVEDVRNRLKHPELFINIDIVGPENRLHATIGNRSNAPAEYNIIQIMLTHGFDIIGSELTKSQWISQDGVHRGNIFSMNWAIPGKMPIWKGVIYRLLNDNPVIICDKNEMHGQITVSINSPGMGENFFQYMISKQSDGVIRIHG